MAKPGGNTTGVRLRYRPKYPLTPGRIGNVLGRLTWPRDGLEADRARIRAYQHVKMSALARCHWLLAPGRRGCADSCHSRDWNETVMLPRKRTVSDSRPKTRMHGGAELAHRIVGSRLREQTPLFIRVHDSANDGRAGLSLHTSFNNPLTPDAPPRESIELRTLVFFPPAA